MQCQHIKISDVSGGQYAGMGVRRRSDQCVGDTQYSAFAFSLRSHFGRAIPNRGVNRKDPI